MPLHSPLLRSFAPGAFVVAALLLPLRAGAQTTKTPRVPVKAAQAIFDSPRITSEELQELTGGPTLITWSGRKVPAQDAIRALLAATNLTSSYRGEARVSKKPVTVDWQNTPFWKAAHDVEAQAGGQLSLGGGGAFVFAPRDLGELPGDTPLHKPRPQERLAAQTPFVTIRAAPLWPSRYDQLHVRKELLATPGLTDLPLTAYFDPKVRVCAVALVDAKVQAREDDPSVTPSWVNSDLSFDLNKVLFEGSPVFYVRPDLQNALIAPVVFKIPNPAIKGTRIFRISGVLRAIVTPAPQTWKIPNLAATPQLTRTVGKFRYSVDGVEVKADKLLKMDRVVLRLSVTPPVALTAPAVWWPFANMHVFDAKGHLLNSRERITQEAGKTQVEYTFPHITMPDEVIKGPYSLKWDLSTEPRAIDLPFELRDVLVP